VRAEHGTGGFLLLDALRPAGAVEVGGLAKAALAVGEVYDVQIVFAEVGKPEGEPGAAAEVIGVGADKGDRLASAVISCVHFWLSFKVAEIAMPPRQAPCERRGDVVWRYQGARAGWVLPR